MASTAARKLGHVKFFNSTKGYGFIIPAEETGQPPVEVFVHHTAINGGGFKSLAEGEEVEYDLIKGPKGMQAANVSGPGGVPVQGDPNAHRPYHRYQNGGGRGMPMDNGIYVIWDTQCMECHTYTPSTLLDPTCLCQTPTINMHQHNRHRSSSRQ
ncbi:cold-shock' DNA-binding domain-containing protein [Fennellomyces sp. T-0311]|nr:cold-shock' DNA-binding domain-containing protein [Fennellomyces sp. T-0311]